MATRRRIVAATILTLALTAQTGCVRMIWSSGQTHGGRANSPNGAATSPPLAGTVGDDLIDAGEAIDDRPLNAEEITRVHPDDRKYLNTTPEIDVPTPNDPNPVVVVTPPANRPAD
jgi:hypothetical protein